MLSIALGSEHPQENQNGVLKLFYLSTYTID